MATHKPTPLERIIQQQVPVSVVTTISRTTEKIAEEMAQEILKDPVWRAQMHDLIRRAFHQTVTGLRRPARAARRPPRRARAARRGARAR